MTTMLQPELPRALIRRVFESDRGPDTVVNLPAADRMTAIDWLRRALLDFEANKEHIALLQQLYNSPFRYPRPRRDCWMPEQNETDSSGETKFTRVERLPEERVTAVLEEGIDALTDDELADLLLNPYALFDLYDTIDELQPERWLDDLHEFAVRAFPQAGKTSAKPSTPPEFRPRNPVTDTTQQSTATGDAGVSLPTTNNGRQQRWQDYARTAATTLACAASLAAMWVAVQTNAVLSSRSVTSPSQQTGGQGLVLHSAQGRSLTLRDLSKLGLLDEEESSKNPERTLEALRAVASPELEALIVELKRRNLSDREVLDFLRGLVKAQPAEERK